MVPWRATEDGYVTDDVIAWYERFARGEPGAIVVEATGIRDVPSGPLLRVGHDRFLPGTASAHRCGAHGEPRPHAALHPADRFLAIRRRPEPAKFFERFLQVTPAHRAALGDPDLSEAEVRARLARLSEAELVRVLTEREWEALRFGYRERVTDIEHAHIRDAAAGAARPVRGCGGARGGSRLRRRRTALRPRLHHGVISLAHQHA